MPTVQRSIRIQEKTFREIEQMVRESGKEFSAVTNELLEEAVRMQRCPGIVFSEGTAGRRARIAGSGIEVWEVIAAYKSMSKDFNRLQNAYHWLSEQQLGSAVGYYKAYTEEIDRIIKQNDELTGEDVHKRYPFLVRGSR
ncbi:MAG: hypothetical protein A2X54_05390 [Nitrospirae bacterium GWF2_44_13]|nr:MAG: hypothetical protein A2X54_05390 [Nitrospirae bacterium GWF2_44_13]OGW32825.1 MAG: hypothetical protein A2088_06160 [Nitrospirae bacterium GWD2_44_7]OGW66147.1 MAG: hypothetical protein A2222_10075 [Nitrospirae bacterium RIFOXYA2_FULL_44_9]HBG93642.1 hypothetical protein [Nitrospiraceae bacterium]HBU05144.1 hypothetical protein [Nitrospiraceae bacterium]